MIARARALPDDLDIEPTGPRILIVDDNVDLAIGLADVLELEGCLVKVAFSAAEGLSAAAREPLDFGFLDFKLPDENGLELLTKIRKLWPNIVATIMSGFRVHELIQEVIGRGSLQVLRGPIDGDTLGMAVSATGAGGLVVAMDGAPPDAAVLASSLAQAGSRVRLCRTREQLPETDELRSLDLLILDLKEPLLRSVERFLELRSRDAKLTALTMVQPADDMPGGVLSCEDTECLLKPFDPELVIEIVRGSLAPDAREPR